MDKVELAGMFVRNRRYSRRLSIDFAGSCLDAVRCTSTVGPSRKSVEVPSSDDFFAGNADKFDIVVLDGMHMSIQVLNDIDNALSALAERGVVIVRGCMPADAGAANPTPRRGAWVGDTYRAVSWYFARSPHLCYAVDADCGLGVIDTAQPSVGFAEFPHRYMHDLTFPEFSAHRAEMLHVVSPGDVEALVAKAGAAAAPVTASSFLARNVLKEVKA